MKLTDIDESLFKALHGTKLGDQLVDYLERMCQSLCDVRNMSSISPSDIQAALLAATHIRSKLINKITLRNDETTVSDEYR